ncbi:leucine-rich repeat domain-containing protein [Nostoc sp.]|uniref:leucine-rich repeat domain-containing protein n=1 Tax=Nostoc sp. TaxID=1180 RepID=UPI002FFD085E
MTNEELLQIIEQAAREKATHLSLCGNQLSSLLHLYNNQLSSLPPEISQLSNLTTLDLFNNQLSSLPPEISQLSNLTSLSLKNNPQLSSPPPEIVEQGTEAILTYLRARLEAKG